MYYLENSHEFLELTKFIIQGFHIKGILENPYSSLYWHSETQLVSLTSFRLLSSCSYIETQYVFSNYGKT